MRRNAILPFGAVEGLVVFLADDADMLLCAWIMAIVVPGPSVANEVAINGSGRKLGGGKKGCFNTSKDSPRN